MPDALPGRDICEVVAHRARTDGATMDDPQSRFGAGALNWRFTLSLGHGNAGSGIVVFRDFPRITPCIPIFFISRATVVSR